MVNIDLNDLVDMGEMHDYGPSEVISKEEEKKPYYPDIYGLNVNNLQAVKDTKVGNEVILVIKAKVKSLEVRENEKSGKKATACLEIKEAAAYPVKEQISNEKMADNEDLPKKDNSSSVAFLSDDMEDED